MSYKIGFDFFKGTNKIDRDHTPQKEGISQPPLQLLKSNQGFIPLPPPHEINLPDISLRKAIEQRRTVRSYIESSISLNELSYLLWCTQGVKQVNDSISTSRNIPSAGARHAFETYLLINRVDSIKPGLYQYAAIGHQLLPIRFGDQLAEQASAACLNQKQILKSAVTFFWVAVMERMTWRYTERGYRYILLDAGHVCQNLYLAAESLNCGVCAIAAYEDEKLNQFVGVDGEEEFAVYAASLGKKEAV